jgi:hypothetical protein
MNDAMNALLTYLEERQRDLLAQLEAIRAIRTLLIAQQEKPSLPSGINALKDVNRILEELPHTAYTPQIREIASSAKQVILEQLVHQIHLQSALTDEPVVQPDEAPTTAAPADELAGNPATDGNMGQPGGDPPEPR